MKLDSSYDTDIMQFGSVLPFETSLGGERNKGGMPTIVATEAQLDVMFSGSDPGSVGLDAARAMSIGGSQGDWTHTGTSISNLTDVSDHDIRDVLGQRCSFDLSRRLG